MKNKAEVIDGNTIAAGIRKASQERVELLHRENKTIRVAVVTATSNPAAAMYVKGQENHFRRAGIEYIRKAMAPDSSQDQILEVVRRLNSDPGITGIIIALPLPPGVDVREVQENIHPEKDIEHVHPEHLGLSVLGRKDSAPPTAQAVLEVLDSIFDDYRGMEAVVVGHSEIVGKPVALGLMERMATVTVCHIETRDLSFHTKRGEILVVGTGKPGLITQEMVREGATVIDVGINRITDSGGNARTVGDVDFDSVVQKAARITPVPGGIGPVTISMILRNAVFAGERRKSGASAYER